MYNDVMYNDMLLLLLLKRQQQQPPWWMNSTGVRGLTRDLAAVSQDNRKPLMWSKTTTELL